MTAFNKFVQLLTVLITLFMSKTVLGTAQSPDKLIYNGKEYSLFSNPLEDFFEKNPSKRPHSNIKSSNLWRGYVATFEIRDSALYLKDIQVLIVDTTWTESGLKTKWKSIVDDLFPIKDSLRLSWLTGLLILPEGELINYVHMSYGSTYEKYVILEVCNGHFNREKRLDYKAYEKFKKKQFKAFQETEEYRALKSTMMKDGKSEEYIDSFLRDFVTKYSSKILVE